MAKIKRKGEHGAAVNYITRTQAIKKLQISLVDFRRLCILKGVYPREPSNKKKASGRSNNANNTFYYTKDIKFLLHEPILQKIREQKTYMKKFKKATARDTFSSFKLVEPTYKLDNIIRERYPTFLDALRDLDDCLSHVFLFASLPVSNNVAKDRVALSQRLTKEFMLYVTQTHSLRYAFVSVKGIYYQVKILGQSITWIVPHRFSQDIPLDVDFRVMGTFLEFYHELLGFVNYKLFTDASLSYPPVSFIEKSSSMTNSLDRPESASLLFSGLVIYLSRETPYHSLKFILEANGALVFSPDADDSFDESSPTITHHIADRQLAKIFPGRFYVQPQWAYDCLNSFSLLQEDVYGIGKALPPHLSPFQACELTDKSTETSNQAKSTNEAHVGKSSATDSLYNEKIELTSMLVSNKKRKILRQCKTK